MDAEPKGVDMSRALEVHVSSSQRKRLQQLRDRPPSIRTGKRAVCLLMSADGVTTRTIRQATGLAADTITDIRRRWQRHGLASLDDAPRGGRPPKVTPAYRHELRDALRTSPLRYGYALTVWSVARLNTHLHRLTDIRVCDDWLRRLIHAEDFVFRRPKHTLKGKRNEKAFRKTQRRLNRLKKGRSASERTSNSGSPTNPSFTSIPI
jgi:transposase